jgi:PAS domain S-box-containing protein
VAPSAVPADPVPLSPLERAIVPMFFRVGAASCLCGAAFHGWRAWTGVAPQFATAAWVLLVGALAYLFTGRLVRGRPLRDATPAMAALSLGTVMSVAALLGDGLRTPVLGFLPVALLVLAVLASPRAAGVYGVACLGALAALGHAQQGGRLPLLPPDPRGWGPVWFDHLVVLGVAWVAGLLLHRTLGRLLARAEEREQRIRGLLRVAAQAYWECDERLRVTQVGSEAAPDHALQVWIGHTLDDLPGLAAAGGLSAALRERLAAHEAFDGLELEVAQPGRSPRRLSLGGEPRHDAGGRFIGWWGTARDVTARHEAEAAVRRSEDLLRQVIRVSPDAITVSRLATGQNVLANDAFLRLSGLAMSEVMGHCSVASGLWNDPEDRAALVASVRESGEVRQRPVTLRLRGEPVETVISGAAFRQGDEDYLVLVIRDVRETERTRRELEAVWRRASVGLALTRDDRFHRVNPHLEAMLGWPPGELEGQRADVIGPDPQAWERLRASAAPGLRAGEVVMRELRLKRHDGSLLMARVQAQAVDAAHPALGTIWIAEDITARREAERAQAAARDAAEAASRAKSAFLANMSHEVRTPLNAVMGLAHLAAHGGLDEARRREVLHQLGESAQSLTRMLSDVLDISKIEAGRLQLQLEDFRPADLLEGLRQDVAAIAEARGLALRAEVDPALPPALRGDVLRLRQILGNFLSNALKFTDRGGVRLRALPLPDGRVRFEVEDTGPGIGADVQARLFQPFTQADESITRRYGGTGLGLSICRELALLMGGSVGVDSTPGHGSRFHADLPLAAADPAALSPPPPPAADAVHPLEGLHVLVAEDNPVNMMIVVAVLEQWGARVRQAVDGAEAVRAVEAAEQDGDPVDVVLMDVQMPVMSGYDATRTLRRTRDAARLPVIALTAAVLAGEREAGVAAGMTDFLTKPLDLPALRAALQRVRAARRT